jgi:hypothetical protein
MSHPRRCHPLAAVIGATALAVALGAPAFAEAPGDGEVEAGAAARSAPVASGADEDEAEAATDPDAAAEPASTRDGAVSSTYCERLVTYTPTSTEGDARAVAITAQALERGVPGWTMVAWEAAAGTTVDAVHVTRSDGATETLVGAPTGSADDVAELTFCGSTAPTTTADEDPSDLGKRAEAPGSDATSGDAELENRGVDEAPADAAVGASRTTGTDPLGPPSEPAPPAAEPTDARPAEAAPTSAPAASPADAEPALEAAADLTVAAGATEPATEVQGVQLARTGPDLAGMTAGGVAGLVAGAAALALAGRRERGGQGA